MDFQKIVGTRIGALVVASLALWRGLAAPPAALALPGTVPAVPALSMTDASVAAAMAAPSGVSRVIARLNGSLTGTEQARLKALHADLIRHLPVIRSVALRVPNADLARLAALPFIERISADASVKKSDYFTVTSSGADVAFQRNKLDGSGVGIAILDSGINANNDLSFVGPSLVSSITGSLVKTPKLLSRVVASVNFVSGSKSVADLCGHGTHVAGIVAGNGSMSTSALCYRTFCGIARNANIVNVRVLNSSGKGNVSDVIAGIQWAIQNKKTYNIRVMNLSLGSGITRSYTTDPLCQAAGSGLESGHRGGLRRRKHGPVKPNRKSQLSERGLGHGLCVRGKPRQRPFRHHSRRNEIYGRCENG